MTQNSDDRRANSLRQKIAESRACLEAIERRRAKRQRARDTKRKIVVGGTVLAAMSADEKLKASVVSLLQERVTRAADKDVVEDLLP